MSYFTIDDQMYAMPFNTSGPVLYYNKKAFGLPVSTRRSPRRHSPRWCSMPEKLKAASVVSGAPFGLKVEPGFVEHWLALSSTVREQCERS